MTYKRTFIILCYFMQKVTWNKSENKTTHFFHSHIVDLPSAAKHKTKNRMYGHCTSATSITPPKQYSFDLCRIMNVFYLVRVVFHLQRNYFQRDSCFTYFSIFFTSTSSAYLLCAVHTWPIVGPFCARNRV